jgi:hypothetical protein
VQGRNEKERDHREYQLLEAEIHSSSYRARRR